MTLLHFYIVIYPAACICILAALFRADRSRAIVPAGIFATIPVRRSVFNVAKAAQDVKLFRSDFGL